MYEIMEYPKERMLQLRKEMGVVAAHEARMAAVNLLNQEQDTEDLDQIFMWMDETKAAYQAANAAFHIALREDMDAFFAEEKAKADADREATHKAFMSMLARTLEEAKAKI